MRFSLFGKSRAIEADTDEFLSKLSDAGLLFEQIMREFVQKGPTESFQDKVGRLKGLEHEANNLASKIGRTLYTEMLIPDLRADVLSLIQDLDYLIDAYSRVAVDCDIERPDHKNLPVGSHRLYTELVENVVKCVEATVVSARAFLRDIGAVADEVHKISFYEGAVDEIANRLKRDLFAQDIPLEHKLHYRYFIDALDQLADDAEDTGEWISIYAIKRSL